jgi:hypothetical protein
MAAKGFFNPPKRIKSYTNDLAPIGFYFDIFNTNLFKIPIMPIPMRIDKLTNGETTYFIPPNYNQLNELFEKLDIVIDFKNFFLTGIINLINYAKEKYREITLQTLTNSIIMKWYENSLTVQTEIPCLTQDFTFLLTEFLYFYSHISEQGLKLDDDDYKRVILQYCEKMITHFKEKIESNKIQISYDEIIKTEQLYTEKNNKYYPIAIFLKIKTLKNNKVRKMRFIPYLIYDDLLDVFVYNRKLIIEASNTLFDVENFNKKQIFNKGSITDNLNKNWLEHKFGLIRPDLETLK